jgi:hypothetical protein
MAPLAPDLGHMGPVTADRLTPLASNFGHVLPILADGRSALPSDLGHVSPVAADGFAALATDLGHVFAILGDRLSALSSRFAGLIGRKFVRPTLDVGGFSTLTRDLALPLAIHRGESAPRLFSHDALLIRPLRLRQPRCLYVWPCAGFHRVKCPMRLRARLGRRLGVSSSTENRRENRLVRVLPSASLCRDDGRCSGVLASRSKGALAFGSRAFDLGHSVVSFEGQCDF